MNTSTLLRSAVAATTAAAVLAVGAGAAHAETNTSTDRITSINGPATVDDAADQLAVEVLAASLDFGDDHTNLLTALSWLDGDDCMGIPIDGSDTDRTWVGPRDYFVPSLGVNDDPNPIGSGTTQGGFLPCRPIVAPDGLTLVSPWALTRDDPHADTVLDDRAAFDETQQPTDVETADDADTDLGYVRAAEVRAAEHEPVAVCDVEYLFNGDPSKARNRVGIRAEGCGPVTVYAMCAKRVPGPVIVEHIVTDGHVVECEPGEHAAHVTYVKHGGAS
jgi:hypothetical protein